MGGEGTRRTRQHPKTNVTYCFYVRKKFGRRHPSFGAWKIMQELTEELALEVVINHRHFKLWETGRDEIVKEVARTGNRI